MCVVSQSVSRLPCSCVRSGLNPVSGLAATVRQGEDQEEEKMWLRLGVTGAHVVATSKAARISNPTAVTNSVVTDLQ